MHQIKWYILFVLHDHNHITISGMGKSRFIQNIGIMSGKITNHHLTLFYSAEDIVNDGRRSIYIVNSKWLEIQAFACRLYRFINRIEICTERHHNRHVSKACQRPRLNIESFWAFFYGLLITMV